MSGATGYQLDVSTNSSFSDYVSGFENLDVGDATSQSVTGLNAGTPYYYRVRAYDGSGTSENSETATATTLASIISLAGNLEFGDVTVGTSAQSTLTISNNGNSTLTVSNISYPDGFGGDWSGAIPAGSSTNVTVTFSPTSGTSYSGTVTVNSDATSGVSTISASGTGATRIISLSGSLDFGYVTTNSSAQTNLTIYNNGNSTLTVSNISYPDGFGGDWSGTIPAGNSQNVTVTFSPTSGTSYNGTVTVNSDATSGVNTASASGTGATRIISLSGNLDFGYVTTNSSAQTNLTIYNNGNTAMTVSSISYPSGFSGSWSGTIPATNSQNVTVTFRPTSGTSYGGTVTVNSDATSGDGTISASGTGATRIISLSGNLAFGYVTVNTSSNKTLTISNNGNSTMTVSSISYSTNVFSGNWSGTIPATNSQNVTVTFSPTNGTGYSCTVKVNSDATSGTNTISATGTNATRIIALSGSLAFGNVTVGTTSSGKTLTITNKGNSTMTVTSISYPNCFSGNWPSGTIAAGSRRNVTVTFSPTSATTNSGNVTVNSDATSGGNTIGVSGTGTARVISLSGNLAFGNVTVGKSAQSALTIYNTGNLTMTVSGITYPSCFGSNWSGTIPANKSTNVTVTFSPTSAISYSGTVTVSSDATSGGTNTISASGTGTEDLSLISSLRTTNGYSIQWSNSAPGQAYTVQSRDNMADGIWLIPSSPQPWPMIQTQWNDTTLSTQLARFYRVVAVPPATRGKVLSSALLTNYSISTLSNLYQSVGLPPPEYAVNWYSLVYETIDPIGGRTIASGGLFLPQNAGKALPLASYSHGTSTTTNAIASVLITTIDLNHEYMLGVVFASTGYAVVLADLLGIGSSPGLHPYCHARSEATASVDMLRAARNYCASNSIGLNGQLFITGYSQGGHTVMALHRELERYHTNEFNITASAPMAGPYDMSGTELNDILSTNCPANPYYVAYVLVAYQSVYSLAPSFCDVVLPPYCTNIPPLFNGNTGGGTINSKMPACDISSILTPEAKYSLTNDPGSPFLLALRDNDLYQWKPVAPMWLFHCDGDRDVLPANTEVAYSNFLALGATQVQRTNPAPGADHGGCVLPSLLAAKAWFDSLKQ